MTYINILLMLILTHFSLAADHQKKEREHKECVFLLHGLGRSKWSMVPMEKYLKKVGYHVVNIGYPSKKYDIETLTESYIKNKIIPENKKYDKIHFVTHSMGGILVRKLLEKNKIHNLGKTIMLCPPNQGSSLAQKLMKIKFIKNILGPSFKQLGEMKTNQQPFLPSKFEHELGIITGTFSLNPLFSLLIPGKDDGKVSVSEAKLKGMNDFLICNKSHTFIMLRKDILKNVLTFLKEGKFTSNNH